MKILIITLLLMNSLLSFGQEIPDFKYELSRDIKDSTLIRVSAKIINRSTKSIYFLSESCNGLDYYLNTNIDNIVPYINIQCNVTFPLKIEIKPKSEYVFKTTIQDYNKLKTLSLSLNFIQLKSSTIIDGKNVNELQSENSNSISEIFGKEVKI